MELMGTAQTLCDQPRDFNFRCKLQLMRTCGERAHGSGVAGALPPTLGFGILVASC